MKRKKLTPKQRQTLIECTYAINLYLINVLGLHVDKTGSLRNDENELIQIKNRELKVHSYNKEKSNTEIPFRPLYNAKLMQVLFALYTMEIGEDGRYIEYIEYGPGGKKDRIWMKCKESGYDPCISKPYFNDSIRYIDIISQLAEFPPPVDLTLVDDLMNNN